MQLADLGGQPVQVSVETLDVVAVDCRHVSLHRPTHHPREGRAPVIPAGDAGVDVDVAQDVAALGG